jgi:hypothetical protein
MRRAYLFIETGEVRTPKENEWGISDTGNICEFASDNPYMDDAATILTRHEIEIPEGAEKYYFQVYDGNGRPLLPCDEPPLPRPKKKVKVYQWLYKLANGNFRITEGHYANDLQAKQETHCGEPIRPVFETEKEVEV